ncbi:hypothetical protein Btru_065871 [Bulinus truncatus]|nr:hypothetical protein Btru_065871 [Bulinus truncatus]
MSLPVCKFYILNKSCKFGKYCRYSHSTSDRPPSLNIDKSKNDDVLLKDQPLLNQPREIQNNQTPDRIISENEEPIKTEKNSQAETEDILENSKPNLDQDGNDHTRRIKSFSNNYSRRPICHYYLNYGSCRNGHYCRFSHQISNRNCYGPQSDGPYYSQQEGDIPPPFRKRGGELRNNTNVKQKHGSLKDLSNASADQEDRTVHENEPLDRPAELEKKVCPFFKSGRFWRGNKCKFEHPGDYTTKDYSTRKTDPRQNIKGSLEQEKDGTDQRTDYKQRQPAQRSIGFKQTFTYAELEEFGLSKVREVEISVMKKRFPKEKINIVEDEEDFSLQLSFSSTDPDWPFDITQFELLFKIPQDYPRKMMTVIVPGEQDLPETVRRYVEVSIKEWLEHKTKQLALAGKVELVFRPFLRWLDRNIEDIVTEALQQLKRELIARAAGLEFIPAAKLKERFQTQSESSDNIGDDGEQHCDDQRSSSEEQRSETESESDEETLDQSTRSLNLDPDKKGTEIALQNLQLRENASAILFEAIKLILQCQRCKHHSELTVLPNRVMSIHCEKCNQNQFVNYRPSLIHQFTSIVGYLDVDGCQAFDLIFQDCRIAVTCLGCSKPTKIDGMVSGQLINGWCQACNARFKLATEAVKFSQLVPSEINTAGGKVVEVATAKKKKPPKDPAIREGYPLPGFGTCKHYKHSYRWLRFPCCGKAYPCDVCHDKKEDHEMIMATRMICGHCCKEQNYSGSRPCNSCGQHMTKIRSAHWEGGKGCRDKIAMSKSDQQKYKNMNKTQSNHKKKVENGPTKKNTKLRHS